MPAAKYPTLFSRGTNGCDTGEPDRALVLAVTFIRTCISSKGRDEVNLARLHCYGSP